MKILQISPQAPSRFGGGGIGVEQTILSLAGTGNKVDYIGPQIDDKTIEKLYDNTYYLEPNKNTIVRAFDSIRGITNARYRSWVKWATENDISKYDAIVMDFTKLHYCLPYIKDVPLYVRVHNIEYDYSRNDFRTNRSIKRLSAYVFAKRNEKQIVYCADKLAVLTKEDARRLIRLYGHEVKKRIRIIPVCVKEPHEYVYRQPGSKLELLVTGSLWYGSNFLGIKWLINNVLPKLNDEKINYHLTIAGSRPNEELKHLVNKESSISLIDSPEHMEPYFDNADMVLVPVFDGAGMKVKTAEALSFGKPMVATSHALIGYSLEDGKNVYRADTDSEFVKSIINFANLSQNEKKAFSLAAYSVYKTHYSIDESKMRWQKILVNKG